MSIDLQDVRPTVIVVVKEAATPSDVLVVDAHSRGKSDVTESAVAVVVIEVAGIVGEVGLENVKPSVAVIIGDRDAHSGLFVAILAVRAAGDHGDIRERSIVIVVKENAGFGIHGDINIGPAIIIKIIGDRGDGIPRPGLEDSRLRADVGKGAVAVVVEENVGVAGSTTRAAHDGDAFPLALGGLGLGGSFFRVELDVIADEKIEAAVAVVIEPGTAGAPADLFVVDAGFAGDIGKGAVAVVVKEDVVSPEAAEEVVPAVVVVVADANAGLPAGAGEAGFFGDVGEGAVAIVFVKMGGWGFAGGPVGIEASSIGEIDVQPAVMVVVEKGKAAALGFNNVFFVIEAAPNIGGGQAGFASDVDELDWGGRRWI